MSGPKPGRVTSGVDAARFPNVHVDSKPVGFKFGISTRRTFIREFKLKVIREVEAGKSQAQVAREYQITETTISKWRRR